MKKIFENEIDEIWKKIESRVPMCFSRYADGEVALMTGKKIGNNSQAYRTDGWKYEGEDISLLGKDLLYTLNNSDPYYYYAISCKCCDPTGHEWLLSHIKQDRKYITFANLWINGNYNRFIDRVSNMKRGVTMIANQRGEDSIYPFKLNNYMSFGDDCVNMWENNREEVFDILRNSFIDSRDETFFISVGPLSEVIISFLWRINPRNQYIDIGSGLDEFVHGRKTRPYMIDGSFYNKQICEMEL